MRKTWKLFFVLTLFLMVGLFSLYAQGKVHSDRFSVCPIVSCQKVFYEDSTYENRNGYAPGTEFSYSYLTESGLHAFTLGCSYEHFYYYDSSFHDFNDIKFKAGIKHQIISFGKADSSSKLYIYGSGGADFVIRDDGDTGLYPLFEAGLNFHTRLNELADFVVLLNCGVTIQDDSRVLHSSAGFGISWEAPKK